MVRHPRSDWLLAACLSWLAGYVDALGFLRMGGLFISFMSGNSTRLAVGLVRDPAVARLAAGLVGAFIVGVILGALVAGRRPRRQRAAVLALVTLLLGGAAILSGGTAARWTVFALAMAMGAENAVFLRDGEVSIGVTYMTGTLVKLGQRIALALRGGARWGWVPYLLLWGGLIAGAVTGAVAFVHAGGMSIWIAVIVAGVLSLMSMTPMWRG